MDSFTWVLIAVVALCFIVPLISKSFNRIPCSKCNKKGVADKCEYEGCNKVYCSNCLKTNLPRCKKCESTFCLAHINNHKCEEESEESEEDDEIVQYYEDGKYATLEEGNADYEYDYDLFKDVNKLEKEGYRLIAVRDTLWIFKKEDIKK